MFFNCYFTQCTTYIFVKRFQVFDFWSNFGVFKSVVFGAYLSKRD